MTLKRIMSVMVGAVLILGVMSIPGHARQQKSKNFVLIVDQSGSMNVPYHGKSKHLIAREITKRFLESVPKDMDITGAMYMYGIMASEESDQYVRVQGFKPFELNRFKKSRRDIKPQSGPGALDGVLRKVRQDAGDLNGRLAVIIISGGITEDYDASDSREAARDLRRAYGNSCIYTILVGNSNRGGKNLDKVADVSDCNNISTTSDVVDNNKGMQKFINRIFYKKGGNVKDADDDGVEDKNDQCPNTPYGANVNSVGCWVLSDINFDVDKAVIKPRYYNKLDSIAAIMNANPRFHIQVEGHTDSTGKKAYNQSLSNKRANAVKNYLINQGDVDPDRLTATGKGETEPVASNNTSSGRAQNRRIEFEVREK